MRGCFYNVLSQQENPLIPKNTAISHIEHKENKEGRQYFILHLYTQNTNAIRLNSQQLQVIEHHISVDRHHQEKEKKRSSYHYTAKVYDPANHSTYYLRVYFNRNLEAIKDLAVLKEIETEAVLPLTQNDSLTLQAHAEISTAAAIDWLYYMQDTMISDLLRALECCENELIELSKETPIAYEIFLNKLQIKSQLQTWLFPLTYQVTAGECRLSKQQIENVSKLLELQRKREQAAVLEIPIGNTRKKEDTDKQPRAPQQNSLPAKDASKKKSKGKKKAKNNLAKKSMQQKPLIEEKAKISQEIIEKYEHQITQIVIEDTEESCSMMEDKLSQLFETIHADDHLTAASQEALMPSLLKKQSALREKQKQLANKQLEHYEALLLGNGKKKKSNRLRKELAEKMTVFPTDLLKKCISTDNKLGFEKILDDFDINADEIYLDSLTYERGSMRLPLLAYCCFYNKRQCFEFLAARHASCLISYEAEGKRYPFIQTLLIDTQYMEFYHLYLRHNPVMMTPDVLDSLIDLIEKSQHQFAVKDKKKEKSACPRFFSSSASSRLMLNKDMAACTAVVDFFKEQSHFMKILCIDEPLANQSQAMMEMTRKLLTLIKIPEESMIAAYRLAAKIIKLMNLFVSDLEPIYRQQLKKQLLSDNSMASVDQLAEKMGSEGALSLLQTHLPSALGAYSGLLSTFTQGLNSSFMKKIFLVLDRIIDSEEFDQVYRLLFEDVRFQQNIKQIIIQLLKNQEEGKAEDNVSVLIEGLGSFYADRQYSPKMEKAVDKLIQFSTPLLMSAMMEDPSLLMGSFSRIFSQLSPLLSAFSGSSSENEADLPALGFK